MKKEIIIFLLLISSISSCKKATKRKVVNYWKVESYELVKIENVPGGYNSIIMNIKDSKYKCTSDFFNKEDTTEDGKVQYFFFTIKKDGTWSSEKDLIYQKTFAYNTQRWVEKESGTWSFLGKSKADSYKKNERIIFNTLKRTYTKGDINNFIHTMNYTYLPGESLVIYSITEASNNKLKLELQESSSFNSSTTSVIGETYKTMNSTKISLVSALP
jgi:hypothetical protein